MSAATIAAALGGKTRSGAWHPCRCPICGDDTLGLRDAGGRLAVNCFHGCSRAAILAELRRSGIWGDEADCPTPDPETERRREAHEAAERARKIALARDIWGQAQPAAPEIVGQYLQSRGITLHPPPSLRYLGRFDFYARHPSGEQVPVLVAAVEHAKHGFVAVHRTFLAPGCRGRTPLDPPRISTGVMKGGAVRLGPVAPGEWLVVGEGIETVLSVMQACGLAGLSALSATGLASLVLPPEADKVLIAADNDENGTGQLAAARAAARFRRESRRVKVIVPPIPGTDWNDVLRGRAPGGLRHAA